MNVRKRLLGLSLSLSVALLGSAVATFDASAQGYPTHPVRWTNRLRGFFLFAP